MQCQWSSVLCTYPLVLPSVHRARRRTSSPDSEPRRSDSSAMTLTMSQPIIHSLRSRARSPSRSCLKVKTSERVTLDLSNRPVDKLKHSVMTSKDAQYSSTSIGWGYVYTANTHVDRHVSTRWSSSVDMAGLDARLNHSGRSLIPVTLRMRVRRARPAGENGRLHSDRSTPTTLRQRREGEREREREKEKRERERVTKPRHEGMIHEHSHTKINTCTRYMHLVHR